MLSPRLSFQFFQMGYGIEIPCEFLDKFRETETHSSTRDSCHMSTSGLGPNTRKIILSVKKLHFFKLAYNFCSLNITKIWWRCSKWSDSFLLYNKISSKYTIIEIPMQGLTMWFINLMNILGAFDNPNGITIYSYNPSLVLNVVFHSSLGRRWYPFLKSILEKIDAPCN